MREWLVLLAVGIGTYAARAAFLVAFRSEPPRFAARCFTYVAPAVLAAIVAPALVAPEGEVSLSGAVPSLAAAVVCWLVWRRTASFLTALLGGLFVAFALDYLLELA
ncbi:AzlD domain-containing protein [Streptomyces sp. NPDC057271]|uniref:AzlD domain-containing protein n=1 Tax=unclassified Streptomyces TaxID=2593676 RepID=UPI00363021BC